MDAGIHENLGKSAGSVYGGLILLRRLLGRTAKV